MLKPLALRKRYGGWCRSFSKWLEDDARRIEFAWNSRTKMVLYLKFIMEIYIVIFRRQGRLIKIHSRGIWLRKTHKVVKVVGCFL